MQHDPERSSMVLLIIMAVIIIGVGGGFFYYLNVGNNTVPAESIVSVPTTSQTYQYYLVKIDDGGKAGTMIGCGDSLIAVSKSTSDSDLMRAALRGLLVDRSSSTVNTGLYNSLAFSTLDLENVVADNGKLIVKISGNLKIGGTCDNPRIKSQIEETVKQYADGKSFDILINNTPLDSLLSLK